MEMASSAYFSSRVVVSDQRTSETFLNSGAMESMSRSKNEIKLEGNEKVEVFPICSFRCFSA